MKTFRLWGRLKSTAYYIGVSKALMYYDIHTYLPYFILPTYIQWMHLPNLGGMDGEGQACM